MLVLLVVVVVSASSADREGCSHSSGGISLVHVPLSGIELGVGNIDPYDS